MSIQVLPEQVANQIAAGEVIERPANVVKELLENSLDAEARTIGIQFRKGGSSYIRVSDDGQGMSEEDAQLCFVRHATSKMTQLTDLYQLHSFGFRGEALPSIASVSYTTLQTCNNEQSMGTELELVGNTIRKKRPCTRSRGSTFTVEQLFFNVPVRRKFLKSEATESGHITHWVRLYALAYPQVHFSLMEDGKESFSSPTCTTLEERIDEIWPRRACKQWVPLYHSENKIQISGLICPPGYGYASSQEIYIFINKRPIESLFLLKVIRECYHTYLPPKTYPAVFLFIHLPENEIDVNVHPTKREVRFKHEYELRQHVFEALSSALRDYVKKDTGGLSIPSSSFSLNVVDPIQTPKSLLEISFAPDLKKSNLDQISSQNDHEKFPSKTSHVFHSFPNNSQKIPFIKEDSVETFVGVEETKTIAPQKIPSEAIQFIGFWQNHALYEYEGRLLFFNCRAARTRIVYESILKQFQEEGVLFLQNLLLPYVFTLNATQTELLKQNLPLLTEKNICVIRQVAVEQFSLDALPQWVDVNQVDIFVDRLLVELEQYGQVKNESIYCQAIAQLLAKQSTLKASSEEEVAYLRKELENCQNGITDPDGQLIWHTLSLSDLSRLNFGS